MTEQQRRTLAALADLMLPGGAGQPSAGEVDVAGALVDQALAARPDLEAPLLDLLDRLADLQPAPAVEAARGDVADRDLLGLVVIGSYMMSPAVGQALSYPGQQPKPVNPFAINDVVDEGLLDPVIERGPIYRPTPTERA